MEDFYSEKLRELEEAWSETYNAIKSDNEFLSGGEAMWSAEAHKVRSDDDRPIYSVPLLNPYVDTIVAPCRLTPPAMSVKALDSKVDTLANGIIRGIELNSSASECYSGSLQQAVGGGLGWLYLEIVDGRDGSELMIRHTSDPTAMMIDPLSTRVDGSDAQYACYRGHISKELAIRTYGEIDGDAIEKGSSTSKFFNVPDGSFMDCIWYRLVDGGMQITRTIGSKKVYDQTFLDVTTLPVVSVIGEQLYAGNSNIRLGGLVRRGRGLNESFNVTLSNIMEMVALAPKAPFIGPHAAFKDNLSAWGTANSKPHSHLGYNHLDKEGNPIPAPQRADNSSQTAGLQSVADWLISIQSRAIGMNDVMMGGIATAQESGKSLIARLEAADSGSKAGYMDHLTLSITQLAKSLIQLIPSVYAGERTICVVDENGAATNITGDVRTILTPDVVKYLEVEIQSGPQKEGKRRAAAQSLETMMATAGQDKSMLLMDLWVSTQDLPNQDEIKSRVQKMIPAELLEDENPDEDPMAIAALEEASAVIDEKDQTILWMQGELSKLQSQVTANDNLAKVELRKAEISAQTTLTKAQLDNSTRKEIELLKEGSNDARTAAKLTADQEKQVMDIMAKMREQNKDLAAKAELEHSKNDNTLVVPRYIADEIVGAEEGNNV